MGRTVTSEDIHRTLMAMANVPHRFESRDLSHAIFPAASDATTSERMEALNRLMQRLRKAGLARYEKKKWIVTPKSWDAIQQMVALERIG
jgi:hypothetical protein